MLYEREAELAQLIELAKNCASGTGHVVTLNGEAGIGKSSLLREFASNIDSSAQCSWGFCDALFTPRPLGPVQDIAEQLLDQAHDLRSESGAELFRHVFAELKQDGTSQAQIIVIEDVHWADVGTLDFIRYLGRRMSLCSALLIISFRGDEMGRDHALRRVLGDLQPDQLTRIALSPLSLDAVRELASGSERDPGKLLKITGGNPFFVSEIVSDLASDEEAVPESVQDAVASRLARLDEAHRTFLEALSIIPVSIDPALHGRWITDHETWFDQSLRQGILISDENGRLRFRHELARLATSQRCSAHELLGLHARHLQLMLEQPDKFASGEIVHHAKGAADAQAVLQYAPVAGEKAAQLGAHAEAAAYYATALEFIEEASSQQTAELNERWAYETGLALNVDNRVIESQQRAVDLWRALERQDKVAESLRMLSRFHWYRGEAAHASDYLDESIALFEGQDDAEKLAKAYSMRSQMMMLENRMEEAIDWGNRALDTAGPAGSPEVRVHALNNIGTARLFLGEESGVEDMLTSLDIARANNLHEDAARVFTNLSEYAVDMRKLDLAEDILEQGLEFDTEHDLYGWTLKLRGRKAQLRIEQGRFADAIEIANIVHAHPDQTVIMRVPAMIMLAKAQVRLGDKQASAMLEQARADALQTSEVQYHIPVLMIVLEQAWLNDDRSAAKKALRALAKIEPARFSHWTYGEYVFWAMLMGAQIDTAEQSIPEPFALALDGEVTMAGAHLSALGSHYLGAVCFGLQDDPAKVSEALTTLHGQDAAPAIARLVALATERGIARKALRVARGPYKAARENAYGLTAKEQTVLDLMVKGMSNPEIAEDLSRSPRTIEHHVSAILQKLDADSRLAAILLAQQDSTLAGKAAG